MKFIVERSISIKAPAKKVKDLVLDFHQWNNWSPWTILEPNCKVTVKGKPGEVGGEMKWDGEIIGSGKITLSKVGDEQFSYDLHFLKPFDSQAKVDFSFKETKNGAKVIWYMEGNMPFFMFFMIPMMKGWLGMDFDRGLKMLKALGEEGKVNASTSNKGVVDLEGFSYVGIKRQVHMDKIGEVMQKDFDTLFKLLEKHGKTAQHWVSLYPKMDVATMTMTYIAAVSDENLADVDLAEEHVHGSVETGKALEISHKGSYDFLGNAWSMGMMYLRAKKMKQKGIPFELYWNNPQEVSPDKLKTSVYFPLK